MAAPLPAQLKATADIARFAQRAAQLEHVKPAIAYWCEYWIVNQLLARGLHNTDSECLQYTAKLMDKLEETKSKYADDDAITDDTAGQAYVEQFGLETFERADRAVQANKVTKQTADTFLAASTFFELLNIWGEPDHEIQGKLRYAKWNAVRIVKAIKEGKDPNESNPVPEPEPEEAQDQQPQAPSETEFQQLDRHPSHPPPPTAEEAPDELDLISPQLAAQSILNKSLHPSQEPSRQNTPAMASHPGPPPQLFQPSSSQNVSPIADSPTTASHNRADSVGGGYFPSVPTGTRDVSPPPTNLPTHLPPSASPTTTTASPPHEQPNILPSPPDDFAQQPSWNVDPHHPHPNPHPQPPPHPSIPSPYDALPISTIAPPAASALPPRSASHDLRQPAFVPDDVAIAKAQKHARWAISALNFEDSATAIRELRDALETLGAR